MTSSLLRISSEVLFLPFPLPLAAAGAFWSSEVFPVCVCVYFSRGLKAFAQHSTGMFAEVLLALLAFLASLIAAQGSALCIADRCLGFWLAVWALSSIAGVSP